MDIKKYSKFRFLNINSILTSYAICQAANLLLTKTILKKTDKKLTNKNPKQTTTTKRTNQPTN